MKVSMTISSINDGGYFSAWEPVGNSKDTVQTQKEDYTHFSNGLMQAQSRMSMMYGKNNGKDCVVDFS